MVKDNIYFNLNSYRSESFDLGAEIKKNPR